MAQTKAVTANPIRNNGATVLKPGNVTTGNDRPVTKALGLMDNAIDGGYGAKVILAVSPTSSGNLGTFNAKTNFAYKMRDGVYQGVKLTSTINGSTGAGATMIGFGAADDGRDRKPAALTTTRRINITSWNAVTGAATKGANAGASSSFGSDHAMLYRSNAVPGELTYKTGAYLATNDDYKPRTNP